jgi:hypothetical protein
VGGVDEPLGAGAGGQESLKFGGFEVLGEAQLVDGAGELGVGEAGVDVQDGARGAGDAQVAVAAHVAAGESLGAVAADAGTALFACDRHLGFCGPDADAPQGPGRVVAEDGVGAARQDRGHGRGDRGVLGVTDGVDARVDSDQPAVLNPRPDGARRHTQFQQLPSRDVAVLPSGHARYLCVYRAFFSQGPLLVGASSPGFFTPLTR